MDIQPYITDIGITIAGSVDSGKSTFVGVLNTNELDNGNGSARLAVAKHPHEINSGKTSDIALKHYIVKEKNRAITMIDLCGHEKYFKTTAYGISGHYPIITERMKDLAFCRSKSPRANQFEETLMIKRVS